MKLPDLKFEVNGPIAVVTLNDPETLNSISQAMFSSLERAYHEIDTNDAIRVAIFTGAGRGFCSGVNLNETKFVGGPPRRPFLKPSDYWTHKIHAVTKPTIAAINGAAVGGGLAIALSCDIRVASSEARFSTRFSAIGMPVLDGVGNLLPRAVGLSKALELLYTAEMISAEEAERIGLTSYTVPHDQLMAKATEIADKIAGSPPIGVQFTKYVVQNSLHQRFEDHLPYQHYATSSNASLAAHDIEEGGHAFRERRPPNFSGYEGLTEE